ncbi:putative hexosyltransferase muci70 [Orobanche minor]
MTGGSLGSRLSGSFGSLQQQAQNGGSQHQNLYLTRRPSKTSLTGYREKEKFLSTTFRYLSRKKVAMLVLSAFAIVAFMTGFFTVTKEDDYNSSDLPFDVRYLNKSIIVPSLLPGKEAARSNSSSKINKVSLCNDSTYWGTLFNSSVIDNSFTEVTLLTNPCKDFAFPPPPPGDMRRIGPRPCPVCYVPVEQAIARMPRFPSPSPVLQHLNYFSEENSSQIEANGGSDFGGYPSLKQRNDSFDIQKSMTVHCGFVKGCRPGHQTGFDIDVADLEVLEQLHEVIVASAIFGNYDVIQQPKNIGEIARRNVPFYMFVDEETETYMKNSSILGRDKQVGLWRIIVVRNVPYTDSRRNGKVPKLLLHRLFPNSRYSIWIDGKLQLVVDPYQVLERFLWRQNATFAISRHYRRFDVFEEAEANKAGGKYDNVSIDYQIEFYKKEGLTPYTTAKLPVTSDVPEGCVIIREHIPITNLFSCLWFNEVDRFTSRDQLSFSTVRDKIAARVKWGINMFLDCERRNFVIQAYHRDLLEQRAHMAFVRTQSPPAIVHERSLPKKTVIRRGKEKRSASRRRRRGVTPKNRYNFFI